ncbi:MAG TPA: hypothetical protein VJ124_03270, partial [Pyrinomonadaceae bacterium]|nr:hypothetical protein [Pyrinomonadaceae bacterium]
RSSSATDVQTAGAPSTGHKPINHGHLAAIFDLLRQKRLQQLMWRGTAEMNSGKIVGSRGSDVRRPLSWVWCRRRLYSSGKNPGACRSGLEDR